MSKVKRGRLLYWRHYKLPNSVNFFVASFIFSTRRTLRILRKNNFKKMFEYLEKIRQKPERTKNRIAFLSAFSFSGLIFVVWLTVIYPDITFQERQKQAASVNEAGMFSSFIENFKEGFSGIKNEANGIKDMVSSISTSTMFYQSNGGANKDVNIEQNTNKDGIQIIQVTASSTDENVGL